MTVDRQSHYTYGTLRDAVYKLIGDYSAGGKRISLASGAPADTDNVFLQALNMCLRRVCMSFPLLAKQAVLIFEVSDGKAYLTLPEDFFSVHTLTFDGKAVTAERFCVRGGKLYFNGAKEGDAATLVYASMPEAFDGNTPFDQKVELPDVTCDALIYLTAAELCPSEEAERYPRLIYGYRDIAYNIYNAVPPEKGRNTFFSAVSGLKDRFCRMGR